MKRIHDSLNDIFRRHRLVFWYDPTQEWAEAYETFAADGGSGEPSQGYEALAAEAAPAVIKLKVEGNEFGTKVAIHRDPNRAARYLLYFPSARPPDGENWLLDMLLQGHEYKADRASLDLQEAGLPYEFHPLAVEHHKFFSASKRAQALREQFGPEDDPATVRRKMMGVLANTEPTVDALLLRYLSAASDHDTDPVKDSLGPAQLTEYFWDEVKRAFRYTSLTPTLRDFAATLFRSANPLERGKMLGLHANVFVQQWKDSQAYSAAFQHWAKHLETVLRVEDQLSEQSDARVLGAADTFPAFERYVLSWLCGAFDRPAGAGAGAGMDDATLRNVIEARRSSIWYAEHADGYAALAQAITLRELVAGADIRINSIEAGLTNYMERWHRIDTAYRKFCHHQRRYGQVALLERIVAWVEKTYINTFLLPLAERWGDQVRTLTHWGSTKLQPQTTFFDHFVRPFTAKKQKVFVIISDALRFEAAAEFAQRLRAESRWTAELEAVLAALPSYTQLGMAALLPGDVRSIQVPERTVQVDGKSATGTPARAQILATVPNVKATAVQAKAFLEMNTKTEARALLRDHDVVYIYHDVIDGQSHSKESEATTSENVEAAFDDLLKIMRKVYSANGYNMLLTADHGFLFQQFELAESDELPWPAAAEWLVKYRRFGLGRGIADIAAVKLFTAAQLGLAGDWQAAFPLGLGRFPVQGAGKRYVHGGLSLQEVVVPVLHVHVARADDTAQVEIEILRPPTRITTGQLTLALYQSQPVADKVLPRTLRIGVFTLDNIALSEIRTLTFDSADTETRQRENSVGLTLSRVADDYNNQEVEIRLEETVVGTTQTIVYKRHRTKIQKHFANDFD